MTIKEALDIAIKSGMTTFAVEYERYNGPEVVHTIETIWDYIQGYEDEEVRTLYLGSYWNEYEIDEFGGYKINYKKPQHCHITYK